MKRILILSDKFLPDNSAIINCLNPIISAIKERSIIVDVLTYRSRKDLKKFEIIDNVNIYRVDDIFNLSNKKILKNTILRIYRKLFFNHKFISFGKNLLRNYKYDCVVACSYPFVMEYCASKIVKTTKTPFISYQFDPYSNNNLIMKPSRRKKIKKEINVLLKASKIFLPKENYLENINCELSVLKNKYYPIDFPLIAKFKPAKKQKTSNMPVFAYTGAFYDNIREPKYMLQFFSKLDMDFILYIYCIASDKCKEQLNEYKKILNEKLVLKYNVSKKECNTLLWNCNFPVNLGNNILNQVPSKLYELVSLGKPIINFYTLKKDTSKLFLDRYKLCFNIKLPFVERDIVNFSDFCNNNIKKSFSYEQVTSIYKDSKQVSKEFLSEVEKICENK